MHLMSLIDNSMKHFWFKLGKIWNLKMKWNAFRQILYFVLHKWYKYIKISLFVFLISQMHVWVSTMLKSEI